MTSQFVEGVGDNKTGETVEIDGGILEGGGQILRNAVSYSAILKVPVQINNIRAGRDNPGLRPQHLSGLKLVTNLCNGSTTGVEISSQKIALYPDDLKGGHFEADTKTAGSIALMIQVALPCALFSNHPVEITLKGGTNVTSAPQIDYLLHVFQPMVAKFGVEFELMVPRRGFYPKGGGMAVLKLNPLKQLDPVEMADRGDIVAINGLAFTAGVLREKLARECASAADHVIRQWLLANQKISINSAATNAIRVDARYEDERIAYGNGSGIILTARTANGYVLGADGLGRPGLPFSDMGKKAAKDLVQSIQQNICVDAHLQDQLIIFMALANGKSRIRTGEITLHTKTAIYVAENLTKAKFKIEQCPDETNIIECDGIGFVNRYLQMV